ncbi:MAG: phosphoribosylamine--glycine ligase [Bacteroidetes bacterium CG02_land_8_20_14_3_00_31_25]|nr:MAG: phosphoribosylamine--glycine ligase [Bacteroidetes bacterium CG02_land_8_20_14_3_00_31_25]
MQSKNILILGSGAREHAFAWKLKQSPKVKNIFVAPGNAGTNSIAQNINISINNFDSVKETVIKNNIDLVVVGPEEPIVNGIVDYFEEDEVLKNIPIIAPNKQGAKLEGSKSFAKNFMLKYNIPTAKYHVVTEQNIDEGISFLSSFAPPYVLKADGLAAGKGVLIINSKDDAINSLRDILEGKFGSSGKKVVIEQFLQGIEMSCFILTDSTNYLLLPEAKDYKRIGEGDTGLNTGGMGAVSPVPFVDDKLNKKINDLIIHRTIYGLKAEKINYKGFVFFGLMINDGEPYVIEYNVRMGDPENEVVLPRINNDFFDLLEATWNGTLNEQKINISEKTFVTIIAASKGYPEHYEKGKIISGLNKISDSIIFHSGTLLINGNVITNGGRVLAVSSQGNNIKDAVKYSLNTLQNIHFDGIYYRKDIGFEFE